MYPGESRVRSRIDVSGLQDTLMAPVLVIWGLSRRTWTRDRYRFLSGLGGPKLGLYGVVTYEVSGYDSDGAGVLVTTLAVTVGVGVTGGGSGVGVTGAGVVVAGYGVGVRLGMLESGAEVVPVADG